MAEGGILDAVSMTYEEFVSVLLLGIGFLTVAVVHRSYDFLYRFGVACVGLGILLLLLPALVGDGSLIPWGLPAAFFHLIGIAAVYGWSTARRHL